MHHWRPVMKKFFKIVNLIKKPFVFIFNFIKNITENPRDFLRTGRPGGITACLLLATQFFNRLFSSIFLEKIPLVINFILTGICIFIFVELLSLIVRIIFGACRKSLSYFLTSAIFISILNSAVQQKNAIIAALLMSFALVFAADLIGRCICAFFRTHRFRQVFAYIAGGLSLAYLIFYVHIFPKII